MASCPNSTRSNPAGSVLKYASQTIDTKGDTRMSSHALETAFSIETSGIKFGPGVTREVGYEMKRLGARRVMVVTDPSMAQHDAVSITMSSLKDEGIDAVLFDGVHVEPTDVSFKSAISFASEGGFDGYVAVGGGSSIDTAKAANLYATYPADLLTYVNAPIGEGRPVPGPLKPLIAIPTTSGTGSETTGVAIFDLLEMKAKTGISHRALRPVMGLVDPNNARTLPRMVGRVQRVRRALSRPGVLHRPALQQARRAGAPRPPSLVSGLQPHQRHLGDSRHRDGLPQPGQGGQRPRR